MINKMNNVFSFSASDSKNIKLTQFDFKINNMLQIDRDSFEDLCGRSLSLLMAHHPLPSGMNLLS